jgi:serine/threonine-protein kinase
MAVSNTEPAPAPLADEAPPVSGPIGAPRVPTFPGEAHELTKRCTACGNKYPADFLICPRDATPLESETIHGDDPLIGKVLGDAYQVVALLGEGGMGKVYQAKHLRLRGRLFAVKVLHAELAAKPDILARFQQEAESASLIHHPNVVGVYDVHKTADGLAYIVGEYLDGEELGAKLQRAGRLDVATAVGITRQVCRALGAAHDKGIIHRDMKPENVFVSQRDGALHVKVLDFGISKAGHRSTNLTRTGLIMGTPSYMAPEQARGDKVDPRADVYATGALLYHLLTGKMPFDSPDPTAILSAVLTEQPARPRSIEPSIPEGLEMIVQRAMAKEPGDRFASMAELDFALAPFDISRQPSMHDARAAAKTATLTASEKKSMALEDTARHMLHAVEGQGREARMARPTIVLLSLALTIWLLGGFVAAIGGLVRFFRDGELTATETVLVIIGTVLAALTPSFLYVTHVRKKVWPNTAKAVELATDLWRTAAAALVTYGIAAILLRIALTVFLHSSPILAAGWIDALLFGVSMIGALVAGGVGPAARRLRRRA